MPFHWHVPCLRKARWRKRRLNPIKARTGAVALRTAAIQRTAKLVAKRNRGGCANYESFDKKRSKPRIRFTSSFFMLIIFRCNRRISFYWRLAGWRMSQVDNWNKCSQCVQSLCVSRTDDQVRRLAAIDDHVQRRQKGNLLPARLKIDTFESSDQLVIAYIVMQLTWSCNLPSVANYIEW